MISFLAALKFIAPHVLNILSDLIAKWNHTVPTGQGKIFWQDFDLIVSKVSKLPLSHKFEKLIIDLQTMEPDSNLLVKIMKAFDEEWNELCKKETELCLLEFIQDKKFHLNHSERKIHKALNHFRDAHAAHLIYPRMIEVKKPGVKLIDDALLCLERMRPTRLIAKSGMLYCLSLNNVVFNSCHFTENSHHLPASFYQVYKLGKDFTTCNNYGSGKTLSVTPNSEFITEEYFKDYYGKNLRETSMFDLCNFKEYNSEHLLSYDLNMRPNKIVYKLLGTSIASLDIVLGKVIYWIISVYRKHDSKLSISALKEKITKDPFKYVGCYFLFSRPDILFKRTIYADWRLEEDFDKLKMLIELYRSEIQRGNLDFNDSMCLHTSGECTCNRCEELIIVSKSNNFKRSE
jgi:hypothetical protein